MKHTISTCTMLFVLVCLAFCGTTSLQAQGEFRTDVSYVLNEADELVETRKPIFKFEKTKYDFGTVEQGESASVDFVFTNLGKQPLIIHEVKGSCYCTATDYPKVPILPNETGTITLTYDTKGKSGTFRHAANIMSNSYYGVERVFIVGNVIAEMEVPVVEDEIEIVSDQGEDQ